MDIDDIKKKILEDVDPETKRKRAHERRVDGHINRTGEFNVSDIA